MMDNAPTRKTTSLSLTIKDKKVLYAAYIQFIKAGGLFIPTTKKYVMGDEITMHLLLINEHEKLTVIGEVIWITPKNAQNNRTSGIGVSFKGEEGVLIKNKIEDYLKGMLDSNNPTHTI